MEEAIEKTGATESILTSWRRGLRPDAHDDRAATDEGTPVVIDLMANDLHAAKVTEIDGEEVRPGDAVILAYSGARVTVGGDGTVTYDPSANEELGQLNGGEQVFDCFTYGVSGRWGGSDTASVKVLVEGVTDGPVANRPPLASDDSVLIPRDPFPYPEPAPLPPEVDGWTVTTLAIGEEGDPDPLPDSVDIHVLANDSDPDGDALAIGTVNGQALAPGGSVALASGAEVTVSEDGTHLIYSGGLLDGGKPSPILADVFTYQASDGGALSEEAQVSVVRAYPFDLSASGDA